LTLFALLALSAPTIRVWRTGRRVSLVPRAADPSRGRGAEGAPRTVYTPLYSVHVIQSTPPSYSVHAPIQCTRNTVYTPPYSVPPLYTLNGVRRVHPRGLRAHPVPCIPAIAAVDVLQLPSNCSSGRYSAAQSVPPGTVAKARIHIANSRRQRARLRGPNIGL
jgi:hypothetical protein